MSNEIGFPCQVVKKILSDNADVVALAQTRLYCPKAPESVEVWPIVVFRSTFPVLRDELLTAPGSSGLVRERVRIYSAVNTLANYGIAKKLDNFIRIALQGQSGLFVIDPAASPIVTVTVQGIFAHTVSGVDNTEDRPDVISVLSDYDIWHEQR